MIFVNLEFLLNVRNFVQGTSTSSASKEEKRAWEEKKKKNRAISKSFYCKKELSYQVFNTILFFFCQGLAENSGISLGSFT